MSHPFRRAVEARDVEAMVDLLAEDVVFHSPVAFHPYRGRAAVEPLLRAVVQVFADFRYVRDIGDADSADHALVFRARIGNQQVEGVDVLHTNEHGALEQLTVLVRPLTAALALADAMTQRLVDAAPQADPHA